MTRISENIDTEVMQEITNNMLYLSKDDRESFLKQLKDVCSKFKYNTKVSINPSEFNYIKEE